MDTPHPRADRVETFGCRLNAFESEAIRGLLDGAPGARPRVVFNTCAVTAEAERQARQAIRRARRADPGAEIVVTGCAAQIDPARYAAMAEVDRVVGNAEKLRPEAWAGAARARVAAGDIAAARTVEPPPPVAGFEGRARGFVLVQQGCDHRCTFCIIPQGRGRNRSVPAAAVARQARALVANGYRELALTGVDIASWGADLPGRPRLGRLVGDLLARVPDLPRLRLSSLDPAAADDELIDLFAREPRLMPHLHLSVQAGDDLTLKRMRRRHLRGDVLRLAERLRAARPDIALGADLIAGFPTETEAMFRRTLDLVAEAGLAHLHVFPYSPRDGTPAARMPPVAPEVRRERARRLRDAGAAALRARFESRLGARERVLVERAGTGRTEHYAPIAVSGPAPPGAIVEAEVTGHTEDRLLGAAVAREAA